jgi:5-methylcytosine-specific restriction endonuclease McrA
MTWPASERLDVFPLADLPANIRERIASQVLAARPPNRWLRRAGTSIQSRAWFEWHWWRGRDPRIERMKIPTAMRQAVISRDGLICGICHRAVDLGDVHIDHIVPFSRGGPTTMSNLRVAHSTCNVRRGNRTEGD